MKREQLQALWAQLRGEMDVILAKENPTDDELKRVELIQEEMRGVQRKLDLLDQRDGFVELESRGRGPRAGAEDRSAEDPEEERELIDVEQFDRAVILGGDLRGFTGKDAQKRAYRAGMWALGTLGGRADAREFCKRHGIVIEQRAMSSGSNTAGGYLVPTEMERAIVELRNLYGLARQKANSLPMTTESQIWPKQTADVTAYPMNENTAITQSNPTVGLLELTARLWATLTLFPESLGEDAVIALAEFIARSGARAFRNAEDGCMFLGDGTSTYHGIRGIINKCNDSAFSTGSVLTAASGHTAFSSLTMADFEGMAGLLSEDAEEGAEWYFSKRGFFASVVRLVDALGGNTIDHMTGKPRRIFMGYPVNFSPKLNKTLDAQTSTQGLCILGDLNLAVTLGNRTGMTMRVSNDRYFDSLQVAVRCHERFDINVHGLSNTAGESHIVCLNTPGS